MILCGDKVGVGGGSVGEGGGCPPQKDTRQENNKNVTISDISKVLEGSLSKVETPPPHNLDTIHGLVSGNKHTHTHTHLIQQYRKGGIN